MCQGDKVRRDNGYEDERRIREMRLEERWSQQSCYVAQFQGPPFTSHSLVLTLLSLGPFNWPLTLSSVLGGWWFGHLDQHWSNLHVCGLLSLHIVRLGSEGWGSH